MLGPYFNRPSDLPILTLILGCITGSLFLLGAVSMARGGSPGFAILAVPGVLANLVFAVLSAVRIYKDKLGLKEILFTALGLALAVGPPGILVLWYYLVDGM